MKKSLLLSLFLLTLYNSYCVQVDKKNPITVSTDDQVTIKKPEPALKPTTKPATKPTTEPTLKSATESATESALKPATEFEIVTPDKIIIVKDILFDRYTLADSYTYKDTVRVYQWDKIRAQLAAIENMQRQANTWAVLQNYKNRNGEASLARNFARNSFKRVADAYGVERYQSVPLFTLTDSLQAERYGRDGSPVKIIDSTVGFFKIDNVNFDGEWLVPRRYVKIISDTALFTKVAFVDRTNQNIATLEQSGNKWLVRSMNPITTGVHRPPYRQETPTGLFIIQEKKPKMVFLKDGTLEAGGYSPYASRFCNGGYLHGVPVNIPSTTIIEYSRSLGTIPDSHMCIRNATSHAKFIYDWADRFKTLVFVFD